MPRSPYAVIAVVALVVIVAVAWAFVSSAGGGAAARSETPAASGSVVTSAPDSVGAPSSQSDGSAATPPTAGPSSEEASQDPTGEAASPGLVQQTQVGSIAVQATLLSPQSSSQDPKMAEIQKGLDTSKELGVGLALNTHSGDLSTIDLAAATVLRTPAGESAAVRWVPIGDNGHHRSGVLVFDAAKIDLAAGGDLALIIKDPAGVLTAELDWALPPRK